MEGGSGWTFCGQGHKISNIVLGGGRPQIFQRNILRTFLPNILRAVIQFTELPRRNIYMLHA